MEVGGMIESMDENLYLCIGGGKNEVFWLVELSTLFFFFFYEVEWSTLYFYYFKP